MHNFLYSFFFLLCFYFLFYKTNDLCKKGTILHKVPDQNFCINITVWPKTLFHSWCCCHSACLYRADVNRRESNCWVDKGKKCLFGHSNDIMKVINVCKPNVDYVFLQVMEIFRRRSQQSFFFKPEWKEVFFFVSQLPGNSIFQFM